MQELLEKTLRVSKEINEFDPKSALKTALTVGALGGIAAGLGAKKGLSLKKMEKPVVTTKVEKPVGTLGVDIDKIAEIESSNNPKAENPRSGARGLYQIVQLTWEECVRLMGEDWSWEDAFDPEKNRAVADFYMNTRIPQLLKFYSIPDTVGIRLATYNWGIGNVKDAFEKHGVNFLLVAPEETKKYIEKYEAVEESYKFKFKKRAVVYTRMIDPVLRVYRKLGRGETPSIFELDVSLRGILPHFKGIVLDYERKPGALEGDPFQSSEDMQEMFKSWKNRVKEIEDALKTQDIGDKIAALDNAVNQGHVDIPFLENLEREGEVLVRRGYLSREHLDFAGELSALLKILGKYKPLTVRGSVDESSIDFPQEDLDDSVWIKKEDGSYTTQLYVKDKIENLIKDYPDKDLTSIVDEIHIVGSIATNQYLDDCDIDVHIIPKNTKDWSEEEVEKVTKWFNEHRDEIDGYIETHPVEIYIQVNPNQDLMSEGCYDLLKDEWLAGPKIVPMDYDPYEDFSHIVDDVRDAVEDADILLGELKRDVIDYEVIKTAMERMSGKDREKFLRKLQDKLDEIENDIETLYKKRGEWVDTRREASRPTTPEQALKDVELAKKWRDTNAVFKFINRYHYLKVIKDLKVLLADDEITPDEVDTIKSIIGVK